MDPSKIRGDIGRSFGPEPEKQDEKIDPEKFKKVLKIDESDEAQKRHKRNLKKEEEEGEEEEVTKEESPNAATAFSEFMDDSEKLDSLFDSESGGTRHVAAPKEPSPYTAKPPKSISTKGIDVRDEEPLPSPATPSAPVQSQSESPTPIEPAPTPPKEDSSLLVSQPQKEELKPQAKKRKKKPQPKEIVLPPSEEVLAKQKLEDVPTKKEEPQVAIDKKTKTSLQAPVPSPEIKKEYATFKKHTIESIRERKKEPALSMAQDLTEGPLPPGFQREIDEEKKKKDGEYIEANVVNAGLPHSHTSEPLPPLESSDMPRYAQLPANLYELFERTTGMIYIIQHSDKSSTSVTINMPNTVFDGAELIIDRYSTAPMAFNVQLMGSPEAVKSFAANLSSLKNSFDDAQYNFEVNLLTPVLQTEKKKPPIRRSSSAGGGGGGKKGKK